MESLCPLPVCSDLSLQVSSVSHLSDDAAERDFSPEVPASFSLLILDCKSSLNNKHL